MRVRIDDVFVMKFDDEIERLNGLSGKSVPVCSECYEPWYEGATRCAADKECEGVETIVYERTPVPRKLAIEEFLQALAPDLARVLKHHLLDELLRETAAVQRASAAVENSRTISLDTVPPAA